MNNKNFHSNFMEKAFLQNNIYFYYRLFNTNYGYDGLISNSPYKPPNQLIKYSVRGIETL